MNQSRLARRACGIALVLADIFPVKEPKLVAHAIDRGLGCGAFGTEPMLSSRKRRR